MVPPSRGTRRSCAVPMYRSPADLVDIATARTSGLRPERRDPGTSGLRDLGTPGPRLNYFSTVALIDAVTLRSDAASADCETMSGLPSETTTVSDSFRDGARWLGFPSAMEGGG